MLTSQILQRGQHNSISQDTAWVQYSVSNAVAMRYVVISPRTEHQFSSYWQVIYWLGYFFTPHKVIFYTILISFYPNFSVTSEQYSFSNTITISDKKLKACCFFPCATFSPANKLETYFLCGYFIGQNAKGGVLISIPPHTMAGEVSGVPTAVTSFDLLPSVTTKSI